MTGKPETPVDVFKRSVAAAMRAVSDDRELQVSYGPETPGLRGNKARLPIPARDLPAEEVAQVRGVGDSFALRVSAAPLPPATAPRRTGCGLSPTLRPSGAHRTPPRCRRRPRRFRKTRVNCSAIALP